MRVIHTDKVRDLVEDLLIRAEADLPRDVRKALEKALASEKSEAGRMVLEEILENERIAREERIPLCQDCGLPVLFIEVGQEVLFEGPGLISAVNEGVRLATAKAFLRRMVVRDPLHGRENTGDNTPAVVHLEIVDGENVGVVAIPRGMGSENASSLAMLRPTDGENEVMRFVLETVDRLGANACPPLVVGVGIGGNFEVAPLLAKKALMRPIGSRSRDPRYAAFEESLLARVNALGIGPAGYGGTATALDVHIEFAPTHIAGLPVAVNMSCHALRHAEGSV